MENNLREINFIFRHLLDNRDTVIGHHYASASAFLLEADVLFLSAHFIGFSIRKTTEH